MIKEKMLLQCYRGQRSNDGNVPQGLQREHEGLQIERWLLVGDWWLLLHVVAVVVVVVVVVVVGDWLWVIIHGVMIHVECLWY